MNFEQWSRLYGFEQEQVLRLARSLSQGQLAPSIVEEEAVYWSREEYCNRFKCEDSEYDRYCHRQRRIAEFAVALSTSINSIPQPLPFDA